MEEKAQGAIEYLLIIGAAILVVAIVIIALSGVMSQTDVNQDVNDFNEAKDKLRPDI